MSDGGARRGSPVSGFDGAGSLPPGGVRLRQDELVVLVDAIRALIAGTTAGDPIRAHVLTIAIVIADAVDRGG